MRQVGEIMHRDFIAVSPRESLQEALELVRMARIRHLLVVRDGILVGVISSRDLLDPPAKGLAPPAQRWEGLASVAIEEAMNASPEVVTPTHSLEDAASRMVTLRIGCLPVVEPSPEGPRVLGLITESDLLRAAYDPWFHRTGD